MHLMTDTASGACILAVTDFSIDLVVGATVATDSADLEDSITCRGFSADFLFAVFFVERDSAFAWTMPFLFCLAGGRAGGFSLVIGVAYRREVDI
jgi:hypothetical protein